MPRLSYARVYDLAYQGLTRDQAIIATAIAFAESGGNSAAIGDVALENATWGPSVGLWQIRSLKAQKGTGGTRDATRLKDPGFNAQAMIAISNWGRDWAPWSTYKNGAYKAHLAAARRAAADRDPSGTLGGGTPSAPTPGGGTRTGGSAESVWDLSPLPGDQGLPGYLDDLLGAAGDQVQASVTQGIILASLVTLGGTLIVLGAWRAVQ